VLGLDEVEVAPADQRRVTGDVDELQVGLTAVHRRRVDHTRDEEAPGAGDGVAVVEPFALQDRRDGLGRTAQAGSTVVGHPLVVQDRLGRPALRASGVVPQLHGAEPTPSDDAAPAAPTLRTWSGGSSAS
jgi:hypothetical protein